MPREMWHVYHRARTTTDANPLLETTTLMPQTHRSQRHGHALLITCLVTAVGVLSGITRPTGAQPRAAPLSPVEWIAAGGLADETFLVPVDFDEAACVCSASSAHTSRSW